MKITLGKHIENKEYYSFVVILLEDLWTFFQKWGITVKEFCKMHEDLAVNTPIGLWLFF